MTKKLHDRIVAYAAWHPTKGFDEHHYEGPIAFADLEDDGGVIEVVKRLKRDGRHERMARRQSRNPRDCLNIGKLKNEKW